MKFILHYEEKQGVLMRILSAVSRRALTFNYVQADNGVLTLRTNCNLIQAAQLQRDWLATVGVTSVEVV